MKFLRIILTVFCVLLLVSCIQSNLVEEKPKYMWFDAEANFERFSNKDSIKYYLDKTQEAGFNTVVIDARGLNGYANYNSEILLPSRPEQDWDYLQFFIDESHKRGFEVCVSTVIFSAGRPSNKTGVIYDEPEKWDGKTAVLYKPTGMIDIKDDSTAVGAFLNPSLPEVQDYALSFIEEIVTKYNIDAIALDYCRYSGIDTDFSPASRANFEKYIGKQVDNFPEDIFTWEKDTEGKYYVADKELAPLWYEFRSMVIHDFVKRAKETIKSVKPNVRLEYWNASWHHVMYRQGQNWASKSYDPYGEYPWASENYKNTGFAEHLDRYMNGAYLDRVYGLDDPESIEFAYEKGKRIIDGATSMVGSIYALSHQTMEDAAYLSLVETDGLVVFDIVQVIRYDLWDEFKRAIDKYESEK